MAEFAGSEEWKSCYRRREHFNRSSVASILGSAEIVAEFIHPELCGMYGHHGTR